MQMVKDTETLNHEIRNTTDIDVYMAENEASFSNLSFPDYLSMLLSLKSSTIAEVQRRGRLTNYIYEIFNGKKTPARNSVLQLCFGFRLTIDEAQRLLRMAKVGALYAKDRRDSLLLFGLKEGIECSAVNDLLDKNGMECIS